MIKIKPQNPKGVRDYLPQENRRREYIIHILRNQFERFGFQSIYTPVFERLETLQGKYGDEGDKLLFKILNSGEYISETAKEILSKESIPYGRLTSEISSKGLRYDHTVPLARFVSQHQNELTFPFKRYVIAPVWRADRPQKGRYQEFYQCDVDVVGSKGLVSDVEMVSLIDTVFQELKLKVEIKINNRKIYNGICQIIGIEDRLQTTVSTILDKWDKIGDEKLQEELTNCIGLEKTNQIIEWVSIKTLNDLEARSKNTNELFQKGMEELKYIFQYAHSKNITLDLKLLRGLDYYTGTVLEVVSQEVKMGSILGGGRYDNLTELFGLKDMSGIGVSFGLDRIYDVMTELHRFPEEKTEKKILILYLHEPALEQYYSLLTQIRRENIAVDLYPALSKIDKQLNYADKSGYTHAIIIGEEEWNKQSVQFKDLQKRKQQSIPINELISTIHTNQEF